MRLAVGFLAVLLAAAPAVVRADDSPAAPTDAPAPPPKPILKVALRVVRVMPDSKQALLFDKNHGKHVLVELDGWIEGYQVTEIDEDSVTLTGETSSIVLSGPQRHRRDAKKPDAAEPTDPYADAKDSKPTDPYAEDKTADATPEDPYKDKPVHAVEAPRPIEPGSGGVRVVEAPGDKPADKPATKPAADKTADTKPPAPTTTTDIKTPAPATPAVLVLTHAQFQHELADFGKLAGGVKAAFVDTGVRIDAVSDGSLFARAGLRAGDLVLDVDGRTLHSIDDAAELYAHAGSAKAISIDVTRAGKPVTLRVTIQ